MADGSKLYLICEHDEKERSARNRKKKICTMERSKKEVSSKKKEENIQYGSKVLLVGEHIKKES